MPHLVKWQEEMGPFGLVIIGPHVSGGADDAVVAKAKSLRVNFTVTKGGGIPGAGGGGIPHAYIFDHTGSMIFDGHPTEAEAKLKKALGKSIVENLEKTPKSKQVVALCQSLQAGQPPLAIMQKAVPLLRV